LRGRAAAAAIHLLQVNGKEKMVCFAELAIDGMMDSVSHGEGLLVLIIMAVVFGG
jgi:hypothetical protein